MEKFEVVLLSQWFSCFIIELKYISIFKSWKPSSVAAEAGGSLERALITTAWQCMERMPLGAVFFFLSVFELEDFYFQVIYWLYSVDVFADIMACVL